MSFLTGTQSEVIYNNVGVATQLNTFTTEDNLQKTYPPVILPAGFFLNPGAIGKSLKIKAWGQLGTTSAPTFTFSLRLLTSTTWSAGGLLLGSTAAITAGTTQTLAPFTIEADISLKALGIGGTSTVQTQGEIRSPLGLASPFSATIPANNTAITLTTLDNSVTYYLFLSVACGTSNAANLVQLTQLKVHGEN
jgi:hypothetical protein